MVFLKHLRTFKQYQHLDQSLHSFYEFFIHFIPGMLRDIKAGKIIPDNLLKGMIFVHSKTWLKQACSKAETWLRQTKDFGLNCQFP